MYMNPQNPTTWCTTLTQPWHKLHSAFLKMFMALWRRIDFDILIVIISVFEISQKLLFMGRSSAGHFHVLFHDLSGLVWRLCATVPRMRLVYMALAAFATWTVEPISSVRDVLSLVGCSQDVWESCVEWIVSGTACARLPEKTREWMGLITS